MKKPKVTVESTRTVTVKFGKHQPTFHDLFGIVYDYGLTGYAMTVYDDNEPNYDWFEVGASAPSWIAKFCRV
jgi:hypothetical protein